MVSRVTLRISKNSPIAPRNKRSFERPSRELPSIDSEKFSKTSGLDHLWKNLQTEGVLKRASDLISSSQDTGLLKHYESAWGVCVSWCSRQKVCPTRCEISYVLNFSTELFDEGHQYNTTVLHKSALSAFHDPIQDIKIGDHRCSV